MDNLGFISLLMATLCKTNKKGEPPQR